MEDEKTNKEEEIKDGERTSKSDRYGYYHSGHSHAGKAAIAVIALLLIVGGAFWLGRTSFGGDRNYFGRGNIYYQNGGSGMMGGRGGYGRVGMMGGRGGLIGGNLSGQITNITGSTITVKDTNDKEYPVVISDTTSIIDSAGNIAKQSDLQVNNSVLVSGPSNSSGQVSATIIRIK